MVEKAKENLESARKKALQEGVETETFVREGEPYAVITSIAEELKSDTIIMGSKGKTQLGRILMGSVTSRVIGYAPCPIMVINR
jgi:nucleotide-binding universal stress UspA family protein